MGSDPRQTPAMKQYFAFKRLHPGALLMFRMGDFYELFDEDAETASRVLGLTLTKRQNGLPMAGAPHHQLESYIKRATDARLTVAVADQVQDPKDAKGVVARAITRVITPGTRADAGLLADDELSVLAAVVAHRDGFELASVDLASGAVRLAGAGSLAQLADELAVRSVRELLYPDPAAGDAPEWVSELAERVHTASTPRASWTFRPAEALEACLEQYGVGTLEGFGLADDDVRVGPLGAALRYLRETQTVTLDRAINPNAGSASTIDLPNATLRHLAPPTLDADAGFCIVDSVSLRSLEVERTLRSEPGADERAGSLLGLFLTGGLCRTPMGRRRLRDWLVRPLGDLDAIRARQAAVATLVEDARFASELRDALDPVQDVPRLAGRLALGRAGPRDLVALGASLSAAPDLAEACAGAPALDALRGRLCSSSSGCAPLGARITETCVEEPPSHLREGGLIRDGVDAELDEARALERDAGAWLADYQSQLHAEHDLPSLKVGFNRVFGYYIELPAAQAKRAPDVFTRKQTLKNAERFTTPQLKAFEDKVLTASERATRRERALFDELCALVHDALPAINAFGDAAADLDATSALAAKAARRGWVRPDFVDEPVLRIHGGRHPVLAESLAQDFVPNDTELGRAPDQIAAPVALVTGPNMAGKSTYIRQTALLVLLAHAGSFVPADRMTLGTSDRICTRVGADDALHRGQSTFMVEMTETASILHHATGRSLIILDEIGRGTGTLDGLSLAWAIAEHLATRDAPPRTLFATHYHELTALEEQIPAGVRNLHVAVRETPGGEDQAPGVVFLHRILPGRADRSYGIHVARLAGVPRNVTDRAEELLHSLAVHTGSATTEVAPPIEPRHGDQLGLFAHAEPHPRDRTLA